MPDAAMLAMAFKRAHYVAAVNRRLAKMQKAEQAKAEQATVPADLADQIRARLADDPALPWDAAVADLVRPRGKKPKA